MEKIQILVADDHGIIRMGLKKILLDEFPDAFICEVADGEDLIRKARERKWNIIVSDLLMPGRDGLDVLKQIKKEFPQLPILVLSMYPEEQYAIRALKAGAAGYVGKDSGAEVIASAIRIVLSGKKYISSIVAEKLAENLSSESCQGGAHEKFSDRELEVLRLIATGKSLSQIAAAFSLSLTTISKYRSAILNKLNIKTNVGLTRYAIENKLV